MIPPAYATNEKRTVNSFTIKNTYEYDKYANWTKKTSTIAERYYSNVMTRKIEYY
jgi:hypothetical protein